MFFAQLVLAATKLSSRNKVVILFLLDSSADFDAHSGVVALSCSFATKLQNPGNCPQNSRDPCYFVPHVGWNKKIHLVEQLVSFFRRTWSRNQTNCKIILRIAGFSATFFSVSRPYRPHSLSFIADVYFCKVKKIHTKFWHCCACASSRSSHFGGRGGLNSAWMQ